MALYFSKRNKSNWYWMVFTSKQKFTTEFESNWAIILKKIICLRVGDYFWIIPLTLSQGSFDKIHFAFCEQLLNSETVVSCWLHLIYKQFCSSFFFFFLQWVASVDLFPNEEAHANVVVTKTDSWTEQNEEVCNICV